IAYDTDVAPARRRGEMLEASWRKFHGLVERAGIRTQPLEGRLEAMLFREHDAWLAALKAPAEQVSGMVGIYVAETGRVLLYDTRTSPEARAAEAAVQQEIAALADARALLDRQKAEIARLEEAI